MNDLIPFDYEGTNFRALRDSAGDPWFVAKDACDILGTETRDLRKILDEDEISNVDSIHIGGISTENGGRSPLVVSEAGLYSLILRSRKPEARAFKRWVTHEVLPAIRRHGAYATPGTVEAMLADPDTMIATLTALKTEREARQATERRAVKAETVVAAITDGGGITLTQFHKHHFPDVPARAFFQHLYDHGLVIDQRGKGRWDDKRRRFREGPQHRHPTYKGKAYLYLDGCLDGKDRRREYTKVRPGQPEVDLVRLLARQGLPAAPPSTSTVPALTAA
ncbi:Bro-N domain-containing protein [Actinomyces faecalis]|uniref:BRO-N domain-containing protein n=1 Tax=Actinomyces faecalis TaxID=2722820 RepID=UPI0015563731|nr:BRO family protein [Actinomyces faecalis]